jgi:hypothetical protein
MAASLPPIFAQNLVEYGMLSSVAEALHNGFYSVRDWAYQSPAQAWTLVAVIAVAALVIGRRPK